MGYILVATITYCGGENLPSAFKKMKIQVLIKSNVHQPADVFSYRHALKPWEGINKQTPSRKYYIP